MNEDDHGEVSPGPGGGNQGQGGGNPAHKVELIVNQDPHKWTQETISYADVAALYLSDGGAPSNEYLIKYSGGPAHNPSGTLAPGSQVEVKNGMRFRVSGTGES
jgi:hypothetical protein